VEAHHSPTGATQEPGALSRAGLRRVLAVLCATEITSWGVLYYAFPVLAAGITADTGWSIGTITAAFSLGLVVSALAAAGEHRAGVAAAHGDHDVGGADDLVGPGLGELGADVDAPFSHRLDGGGVDLAGRFRAAGPADRAVAGKVLEEPERHLGAPGVVRAQEQHRREPVVGLALDPGQRAQPLAGELLRE
jgi:hypothetical protein